MRKKLTISLSLLILILILVFISLLRANLVLALLLIFVFIGLVVTLTLYLSYTLFSSKDNIEETLKKNPTLNLTICTECKKDNILEDKYCAYCGSELTEIANINEKNK
ncbi:hypothetical protein CI105_04045 [Candidatus Izimaplasma bacterium ZiA1]|uniref:hypothetical protein n=1 Tax=Candidatus Izimoplasma sp. ZiA1 TaxID=2024899 RepID=UPI000BAA7EA7|nr:hypothetical protein CI105_04045 [Candidatus Izimaplasma bacterium ZiA1]